MCGIFFCKESLSFPIGSLQVENAIKKQIWRGPDCQRVEEVCPGVFHAHARLSIVDLSDKATQPMRSNSGRFSIIFNGEIYNHLELKSRLNLRCKTTSDTEIIINGFEEIGEEIFELLDGMFALIITDTYTGSYWAVRDRFGIKPLFKASYSGAEIISSETISIREIIDCEYSEQSILEWKSFRRPVPGHTYFKNIDEILPGSIIKDGKLIGRLTIAPNESLEDLNDSFDFIKNSVSAHEMGDVENVCLLSGGIDSAIIAAFSNTKHAYSVGQIHNNEFVGAAESASVAGVDLKQVVLGSEELIESWKHLIGLRGEPLSVPNEGLIFSVCKAMGTMEKVVLTGEGADEFFFGYDRIFRLAALNKDIPTEKLLESYCYDSGFRACERFMDFVADTNQSKSPIEFLEDFFITFHLPGLLRRMDSASMAASKEARVPFVCKSLASLCYRKPAYLKIDKNESKIPLRKVAQELNLVGALNRPKIGFSSTINPKWTRYEEYKYFQQINITELGWL